MFRFLSAEALYGLLLVTTFASVGLLGLWAATSRWHPYLRTTIVLAILSVLLLRPMFEPFVMLVSQVATIAAGVAAYRWLKNRKNVDATDAKRTRYQFSLKTLLFVSTLVAMGAAVVAKLPELGGSTWAGIAANGFQAGFGTLLSVAWFMEGPIYYRFATALSGPLCNAVALRNAYVPYQQNIRRDLFWLSGYDNWPYVLIGFGLLLTTIQLVITLLWKGTLPEVFMRTQYRAKFFQGVAILLTAGVFILPGYVTLRLLNPLPLPARNPMTPNAFEQLVKLGHSIGNSPLMAAYNSDPPDKKLLSQEVKNHGSEYELLFVLLQQRSVIPKPDEVHRYGPGYWARSLSYALEARGDVAHEKQDFKTAMDSYTKLLALAQRVRGGLVFDWIVALSIEQMAIKGTYRLVRLASKNDLQPLVDLITRYDLEREPLDDVLDRQKRWSQNDDGWQGHLASLRFESHSDKFIYDSLRFNQAINRLLVLELALRKYQLSHNSLPYQLDQLVPDILPEVPRDPFDPAGGTLRYKRIDDGYILYSVSQDGVDNGGVLPNDSDRSWWFSGGSDLRLDHYFAEPEPETTQDSDGELDSDALTPEP